KLVELVAPGSGSGSPVESAPGEEHAVPDGMSILLAEDHPTNRKVALRMLARLGCRVRSVVNGREAVAAVAAGNRFDLVLMDVQMPLMDGFEATRAIRALDAERDSRTIVVAMTAHAMEGDRGRCLAAGMDDFITKPVVARRLYEVLARWAGAGRAHGEARAGRDLVAAPDTATLDTPARPSAADAAAPPACRAMTLPVLLVARLDGYCHDDAAFAHELVGEFQRTLPRMARAIHEAVAWGDPPRLERAAHSLKGSARTMGGEALAELAGRLERTGRTGAMPEAEELAALDREGSELRAALEAYLERRAA